MGIMPADRELKWQRVFRRFGLPGELPEKDKAAPGPANQRREDSAPEKPRDARPAKKK